MWYETIKRFYNNGHPSYTNEGIKIFVKAKMLTEEEYKLITDIDYVDAA